MRARGAKRQKGKARARRQTQRQWEQENRDLDDDLDASGMFEGAPPVLRGWLMRARLFPGSIGEELHWTQQLADYFLHNTYS
ncbi:Protein of unknown function [Gryllus bimaculatus]|nr:Protein of unknown function [Gryllus bimaculatus]